MCFEIYEGDFKLHVYSICRQHSELKYTKRNLKENEVILVKTNFIKTMIFIKTRF